ncbi:MAG: hypothetical protein GY788_11560, partial [bacterium]|nr:hypothetical protein [bacterium]
EDNTARVWDAATGAETVVLTGHKSGVVSAVFSPDGTRVVTASFDKTARVWDAATGTEIGVLTGHDGPVLSVAFSPDGTRVVTASVDRPARVWDASHLGTSDAFAIACQRLGNNIDLTEVRERYGLGELTPICGDNPPLPVNWRELE